MKKIKLTIALMSISTIFLAQSWQINGNPGIVAANFLGTLNNAQLNFRTNGNLRFVLDNGGTGNNNGSAAFGNNLPLGFVPAARLHLHQTGGVVNMRFTNSTTGSTVNDGFAIGMAGNGDAFFINNTLNQNFSWYNQGGGGPGTLLGRMRLFDGGIGQTTGRLVISNDIPGGFVPVDRLHLHENVNTAFNGIRLSSLNTGQTATDGFQLVINNNVARY